MPFSPDATANYFLDLDSAEKSGKALTPMKLQKLMYFAHGWHLALEAEGKPLVREEVQAWDYGPVFPTTYHEFKDFGNRPIDRPAIQVKSTDGKMAFYFPNVNNEAKQPNADVDLEFAKAVLDRIWRVYSKYSATRLSEMTHEKGSPWWMVRMKAKEKYKGRIPMGLNIPNAMIRNWFKVRFQKKAE